EAAGLLDAALTALRPFDDRGDDLRDLARFIVERDR
ncbi:MAG TPA: farnesyl-diphosphate synthase, partial [Halieaceae bacterium]|nr:farnesyl-diphosphate synthase [Halieaceae bacterium]